MERQRGTEQTLAIFSREDESGQSGWGGGRGEVPTQWLTELEGEEKWSDWDK